MPFDFLAIVAVIAIFVAEVSSGTDIPGLSRGAWGLAVVCLILAGHMAYFLAALLLLLLLAAAKMLNRISSFLEDFQRKGVVGNFLWRLLAAIHHVVGLWMLPVFIFWSLSDSYSQETFAGQEVGHLLPSTFYVIPLTVVPLIMLPSSSRLGGLEHQTLESIMLVCIGMFFYFLQQIFVHLGGESIRTGISAAAWDHQLLGLLWASSGFIGYLFARMSIPCSAQVFVPALWVLMAMLSHSANNVMEAGGDPHDVSNHSMHVWMQLHLMHGLAFGVAGFCRLLGKLPESIFLFFLGCWTFTFSSEDVARWLTSVFYFHGVENYPIAHVVSAIIVVSGAVVFPLHLLALTQMRKALEETALSRGFSALATSEESAVAETYDSDAVETDFDDGGFLKKKYESSKLDLS